MTPAKYDVACLGGRDRTASSMVQPHAGKCQVPLLRRHRARSRIGEVDAAVTKSFGLLSCRPWNLLAITVLVPSSSCRVTRREPCLHAMSRVPGQPVALFVGSWKMLTLTSWCVLQWRMKSTPHRGGHPPATRSGGEPGSPIRPPTALVSLRRLMPSSRRVAFIVVVQ
jgi:hypothetical protein